MRQQDPGAPNAPHTPSRPDVPRTAAADHPHNFDVQKELHQQIRNDPDYDDWEYGTEPLPHEAWALRQPPQASA
ncbi:hypothetical protein [Cyanobium sp. NIES-981]|uniref:hypothetical protein n=1 Tax=Cyanobium sp. NIES-981 TaxID=1851505 RepID=UPI0012F8F4B3|nr:hypothetical protein [Cyanobium sp. NIES-981]